MRALLVVRPNAAARPGGDIVHAESCAAALQALGVDVELVASAAPSAAGFDVAHVFGIFDPDCAAQQIAALRSQDAALVLSPIWLDLSAFFASAPHVERALARDAAAAERALSRLAKDPPMLHGAPARSAARRLQAQRALAAQADVLLPASQVEAYLYGAHLGLSRVPFVVAPLGIDETWFAAASSTPRSGVLCAGRIEPKKNQAALLYALRDVDVEITIVGNAYDEPYRALCRRWQTPKTRFIEHLERDALLALMASAAVTAQPCWFESPGLAALEGAATGAHVVVGDRGCEREYFGPDVQYADPADPASIRAATLEALRQPARAQGDALERRLRERTWRRHAEATLDAYGRAVEAAAKRRADSRNAR